MNLVWFRRDLRIEDNPALYAASQSMAGVIALHITTPQTWQNHNMSIAQQYWLSQNLEALTGELNQLGIPLIQRKTAYFSDTDKLIYQLCKEYNIDEVYFNLEYEWDERRRDHRVIAYLKKNHIKIKTYHEQCLCHPELINNAQGQPYKVFTPYKKASIQMWDQDPSILLPTPAPRFQGALTIQNSFFSKETTLDCNQDLNWLVAGSNAANQRLQKFIENKVSGYKNNRDYPDKNDTSRLSPYLSLGVLSARQCLQALLTHTKYGQLSELLTDEGCATWITELVWRDFYRMICYQNPKVSRGQPFKPETNQLVWSDDNELFESWKNGQTGVPIVDAAMRQLNKMAWMHNRLRMIVAMYLCKNLWIDWRKGEAYFASKLVDWDFCSNNGGWQWCASTGTDAAPYFRIFNPVNQSERFDSDGQFIKKYCPELKPLNNKQVHDPSTKGIDLVNYPKSRVDLKSSRLFAIEQFKTLKH